MHTCGIIFIPSPLEQQKLQQQWKPEVELVEPVLKPVAPEVGTAAPAQPVVVLKMPVSSLRCCPVTVCSVGVGDLGGSGLGVD